MHKNLYIADRTVTLITETDAEKTALENSLQATEVANASGAIHVLLANPGMGKTTLLQQLGKNYGAIHIRAKDVFEPFQAELDREKILLIDGLDELASLHDSREIKQKLHQTPFKGYVLSCRAFDWSASEQEQWQRLSRKPIKVYQLNALTDQDIQTILEKNHGFTQASSKAFIESMREHGLSELLSNPLTLSLLARAKDNNASELSSKRQVYEQACQQLVKELNQDHAEKAVKAKSKVASHESLIQAAGYLSLMYLRCGSQPISLLAADESQHFNIQQLNNQDELQLREALRTRLFSATDSGIDQFHPVHRTVAEYLAARYLAVKAKSGVLIQRIVANLLSPVGGVVSPTRGLLAWLAALTYPQNSELIFVDPAGLVQYGDCKGLSASDKQRLVEKICTLPTNEIHELLYRDYRRNLASLIHEGWVSRLSLLMDSEQLRKEHLHELHLACAALESTSFNSEQAAFLNRALQDERLPSNARISAMQGLVRTDQKNFKEMIESLIDRLVKQEIPDPNDELAGTLLQTLYPQQVTLEQAMRLLHDQKNKRLIGSYRMFWRFDFVKETPKEHLADLMDALGKCKNSQSLHSIHHESIFWDIASQALYSSLEHLGETAAISKLYQWLELPIGAHRHIYTENEQIIRTWLKARPEIIAQLLTHGIKTYCNGSEDTHAAWWNAVQPLHKVSLDFLSPLDWLNLIEVSMPGVNDATHIWLLTYAQRATSIYFYYDHFERWFAQRPHLLPLFEKRKLDIWELDTEALELQRNRKLAHLQAIDSLRQEIHKPFEKIASYALYQIAWAWLGHTTDAVGEEGKARLTHLFSSPDDAEYSENVLIHALNRSDLPDTEKILQGKLPQSNQIYHLAPAMIVGCELLLQRDSQAFEHLPDELLAKALMAQFCYGEAQPQDWWKNLLAHRSGIFATTFAQYIKAHFKAKQSPSFGLYQLAYEDSWSSVAQRITEELLESIPVKVTQQCLYDIAYLLRAGLTALPKESMLDMCANKVRKRSMDEPQRIYWLATALILDEKTHLAPLEKVLEGREIMVRHFIDFMSPRRRAMPASLSPRSMTRLIKVCSRYAQPDWGGQSSSVMVTVTKAMEAGDLLRQWLIDMSQDIGEEARAELDGLNQQLRGTPWSSEINYRLELQRKMWREAEYSALKPNELDAILSNSSPQNHADFNAIAAQTLEDLIRDIEDGALDSWEMFWNTKPNHEPKLENECTKILAALWQEKLKRYGVTLNHEQHLKNDNRADLWLIRGDMRIPIEAKRQNNKQLWTALQDQLIKKYTIDPRTQGFGFYLVFWFGSDNIPTYTIKPKIPYDLKLALVQQLTDAEKPLVKVFVLKLDQRSNSISD
jgi:hypothetical protein